MFALVIFILIPDHICHPCNDQTLGQRLQRSLLRFEDRQPIVCTVYTACQSSEQDTRTCGIPLTQELPSPLSSAPCVVWPDTRQCRVPGHWHTGGDLTSGPSSQSGSGHRTDNTQIRTHRGHIMRIGLLVIVTCQHLVMAQEPVKLGEIVHNLIFPSEQLMGTSHHQHPVSSRFPSKQVLDQI